MVETAVNEIRPDMKKLICKRNAQFMVVIVCAILVKYYYSTTSVDQLRWILAPTTLGVELVTGFAFEFESHAGYMISDRSFLIAAPCAGVNFLITAFLMLSLRRLWRAGSANAQQNLSWSFIPAMTGFAYVATIVANTFRISTSLWLRGMANEMSWLSQNQLHRVEGIFVYFGFLLLLFIVSERMFSEKVARSNNARDLLRRSVFPLLVYYATTLAIPLANAYRSGSLALDFREHAVFVLLTPLVLLLPLAVLRLFRARLYLPLPLGEGRGEGLGARQTLPLNPLPKGKGKTESVTGAG